MLGTPLEDTLLDISGFLNKQQIPYMVIEGIANAFWGIPRATLDIDITVLIQEKDTPGFVKKLQNHFKSLVGTPIEFLKKTRVLPYQSRNCRL